MLLSTGDGQAVCSGTRAGTDHRNIKSILMSKRPHKELMVALVSDGDLLLHENTQRVSLCKAEWRGRGDFYNQGIPAATGPQAIQELTSPNGSLFSNATSTWFEGYVFHT